MMAILLEAEKDPQQHTLDQRHNNGTIKRIPEIHRIKICRYEIGIWNLSGRKDTVRSQRMRQEMPESIKDGKHYLP